MAHAGSDIQLVYKYEVVSLLRLKLAALDEVAYVSAADGSNQNQGCDGQGQQAYNRTV